MTLGMFVIELGAPWLIFAPPRFARLRLSAFVLLVLGQLGIAVTGNYGFFNLLSLTLCVPLLDDAVLRRAIPLRLAAGAPEPRWKRVGVTVFVPVMALLSALAFVREIAATLPGGGGSLDHALLRAVAPLRSINGYGLFRVMTTERPEIVIEGSRDGVSWKEYEFRWKPGALTRRPRFSQPHMPRLDWQMWFAALNPEGARSWLAPLTRHLLAGTPDVLALLGENPFPDRAPRYLRLAYYRYRFSTPAERARSGGHAARSDLHLHHVARLERALRRAAVRRLPVDPAAVPFIFRPGRVGHRVARAVSISGSLSMKATDIRRGHVILLSGQPCRVMDFTHRTPGNLRAFVQVRLRNLVTGNTFDTRLSATDFVDEAPLETKEFQVLYRDQGGVHVMDTNTYEQHTLDAEAVADQGAWLGPEMHIQVEWLNGRPVGIELPAVVELMVVQTSPVMRGATKTASTKPAKLSNGVTIQVPEFINEGEKVRVDPREGVYLERAK